MRFRQLTCPTAKNFYDVCLNAAPFYQNELIEGNEKDLFFKEYRFDHTSRSCS